MAKENSASKILLTKLPASYLRAMGDVTDKNTVNLFMEMQREAERCRRFDSLTGLLNHGTFFQEAERLWEETTNANSSFSLIMLDADYFKQYNDQNGHPAGDQALLAITEILKKAAEKIGFAGRWGGEEFILALEVNKETACQIAEKIRQEIRTLSLMVTPPYHSGPSPLTVSLGVSSANKTIESFAELKEGVDLAVYAAKGDQRGDEEKERRDRVAVYHGPDEIEILPKKTI